MASNGQPITVTGGTGGIAANLDDMRTESRALEAMTGLLLDRAKSAAGIAVDPNLLSSAILSPVTAAEAESTIVFATGQLALFATEAGVSAVFLGGAVTAYETADKALAALANLEKNAVTFTAGALAIPLVIGAGLLVLDDVAATYIAGYGGELIGAVGHGVQNIVDDPSLIWKDGGPFSALVLATASSFDAADAQRAVNENLKAQLQELNVIAGNNAWIVDLIADGAPGLITGLTLPAVLLLGPGVYVGLSGMPWPPTSYEQSLQAIIGAGNKFGLLDDGPPITKSDLMGPHSHPPLPPIPGSEKLPSVTSLSGLLENSAQIDNEDFLKGEKDSFARIRITKMDGEPPHYIVQIPSTQSWAAAAGSTPNDLTSDIHAMLAKQTALASAVKAAMEKANIRSIDPVMLEGFSLGGITAGQMAADPSLHYNITHVVTAGSPIANFDIPSNVRVMSLEFNQDPVARLDGHSNPGSANWTTIHADAPYIAGDKSASPGIAAAHDANRYAVLAGEVDQSDDASVDAWRDSAKGFFGGGTATDYGAMRG